MLWHTQVKMRVPLLSRDDALLEIAGHRMYPRYRPIGKYARSNSIGNVQTLTSNNTQQPLCCYIIATMYLLLLYSQHKTIIKKL